MSPFLYALNIGTLATWLTVAGASTVACVVHVAERLPGLKEGASPEAELFITPMAMGSAPPAESPESTDDAVVEEQVAALEEVPELPDMPEIPDLAEIEPLPDVPDLPPTLPKAESGDRPKAAAARPATGRPKANHATAARKPTPGQSGGGTGQGSGTAQGSGTSASGADRWVGGRMPKPNYPAAARRGGQQGRVVVQFTVDERGYVVDARVSSGSAFPALNDEALRTVRRWKFRPGPRASASRPIIFQLN